MPSSYFMLILQEFTTVPAQKFEHQSNQASTSPLSSTVQENFRGFTFVDDSIINQHMRKLDLDKMDEEIEDHGHHHRDSYDDVSERSIISEDESDDDEDMLVPGSSGRGQRMSGVEETMFEMR
jgi:Protein kinase C terminal domain